MCVLYKRKNLRLGQSGNPGRMSQNSISRCSKNVNTDLLVSTVEKILRFLHFKNCRLLDNSFVSMVIRLTGSIVSSFKFSSLWISAMKKILF